MQKLSRSLIALSGLALLAACGDDVSITPPPEPVPATIAKVDVVPAQLTIKVAEKVILTASVTVNPGTGSPATTVTWTSANTAIATVSAAGEVTGVAPGTTSIRATSTADPTKIGAAAITVAALAPATVSIKSVTTGTTNTPVNFNNVTGQIDVTLNVEPGDFAISAVEVLIDGEVACTQAFSGLKTAEEIAEAQAEIVCSIATHEFDPATGEVSYLNGVHQLSARAQLTGGTSVATPSTNLTFNNQSGFIALVDNTNTVGGPESAINPITGLKWVQGDVELKLAAVNYTAGGATVTSINASFLGKTFTATPAAGTQIFTINFPNSGTGALNIVGYQLSAPAQAMPLITSSSLSSGNQGPTQIVNIGPKADTLGLTRLDSTRVDNVAPVAPTVGTFAVWLNASFDFDTTSTAITNVNDTGVDNVEVEFWVIKGANPTPICSLTGMTEVTSAAGLTEGIVSTDYAGKVVVKDALGNTTCAVLGNTFGVDFTPPANVTFTGVANNAAYNVIATADAVQYVLASTGDNASGISATLPGLVSILRTPATGSNVCELGSGSTCAQVAAPGTGSITDNAAAEGYYTITAQMTDVAGNAAPTPAFTRLFLVDATAPSFTGNVGMNAQYAGNAPAAFTNLLITDNLDLNRLFGVVNYSAAGLNLEYPAQSIGTFGLPLEKTFSGTYTIPSLIRCINAANSFAVNLAAEATQITFIAEDQAANQGTVAPVAGALQAALDNCGAVGNVTAPAAINTFADSAVNYGTGKTQVSIAGTTTTVNSANVILTAIADVTLDNSPEPFSRVEFYYQNTAGNWVRIGQAPAGTLNQTVTTRTWTYKFTWDPDTTVPVNATTNVIAIGVDAQGDAVRTAGVVVNVAP
jgi:hypothetical protein